MIKFRNWEGAQQNFRKLKTELQIALDGFPFVFSFRPKGSLFPHLLASEFLKLCVNILHSMLFSMLFPFINYDTQELIQKQKEKYHQAYGNLKDLETNILFRH